MLEVELIQGGVEIVAKLSSEWIRICEEGPGNVPFFRPEWFSALLLNFRERMEVITVRRNGKLRALLPLMRQRGTLHGLPVRKLQAVFNPNTPRFDLIHGNDLDDKPAIVEGLWKEIEQQKDWDVLECRLVRDDSWLKDVLLNAGKRGFLTGIWPMDSAPFIRVPIPVEGSIGDFFKGERNHLGKELSRRLRRLNEIGVVEFKRTNELQPQALQRYFELESKGWKGRSGTAAVQDDAAAGLHSDFARDMAANGSLIVYELCLDEKTIAMSINIRLDDHVYHWKTSYDENYSRYSPGNLLFRRLLEDCAAAGVSEIDFMCPSLPYKQVWATGSRDHVALYIFRPALAGWLGWIWKFGFIRRLRRLKTAYPRVANAVSFSSV